MFLIVSLSSSQLSPIGTRAVCVALMSFLDEEITVYPSP